MNSDKGIKGKHHLLFAIKNEILLTFFDWKKGRIINTANFNHYSDTCKAFVLFSKQPATFKVTLFYGTRAFYINICDEQAMFRHADTS